MQFPATEKTTSISEDAEALITSGPGKVLLGIVAKDIVWGVFVMLNVFETKPAAYEVVRSLDALIVQVLAATSLIVPEFPLPAVKVQDPAGVAETEKVTVWPDGATALTARLPPIGRSGKVEGVRTGVFARSEEGAATV